MDVHEARRIVLAAASIWAATQMEWDESKFESTGYNPSGSQLERRRELRNLEVEVRLRTEAFDAAVVQLAREIARAEREGTVPTA